MYYRNADSSEYIKIAAIHLSAFPGFFLTTLGQKFLETYYKASLKSKESLAICATNDYGQITGFSIGCIHSRGYHKRLIKQNLLSFLSQGISLLFSNPKALFRLLNNFDKNTTQSDDGEYAELLSIGVTSEMKGNGIGKELIRKFEEAAANRGCKKIALTTDYYNNDAVVAFYKKSGYDVFYEFTTYPNRKMYKLIKNLD